MTGKEEKMQRFLNVLGIFVYGICLPLSCLFMVLGERIPYGLIAAWVLFPYMEQSAMEQLRRKEAKR
ncbi:MULTISPECIES: hypothetical protein [Brevibacillus]|uniref:hypothetical protein n=1 Tax=Brevibacillus TaxID=55080 RepID=UPI0003FFEC15|nr:MULTISPECIES: hypothetical protein [Brevibacillus]UYZ13191.1 hypothetical protein A6764_20810 [Brevibacillus sp. WF146]